MAKRSREHRQGIPGYDESRPTREERKQRHRAQRHAANQMLHSLEDPDEVVLPEERRTRAHELSNGNGQDCGDAVGSWHFVNNQTGGAAAGTLNATFSDGTVWNVAPSAVNKNVQHFNVESSGTLVSASTNLPGKLVLSDFSCEDVKKK